MHITEHEKKNSQKIKPLKHYIIRQTTQMKQHYLFAVGLPADSCHDIAILKLCCKY